MKKMRFPLHCIIEVTYPEGYESEMRVAVETLSARIGASMGEERNRLNKELKSLKSYQGISINIESE